MAHYDTISHCDPDDVPCHNRTFAAYEESTQVGDNEYVDLEAASVVEIAAVDQPQDGPGPNDGTGEYVTDDDDVSDDGPTENDDDDDHNGLYVSEYVTDDDADGILDTAEVAGDMDEDGTPNAHDVDSDGDGILDSEEGDDDTDGDGSPDYLDLDSDGDTILDSTDDDPTIAWTPSASVTHQHSFAAGVLVGGGGVLLVGIAL